MMSDFPPFEQSQLQQGVFTCQVGQQIRALPKGVKVRVYRNLNKPEFFSIMACSGEYKGLVCGYARAVRLVNGRFVVSEKSRQRVLKEQCRNVHAFVEGELMDATDLLQHESLLGGGTVSYNPYKMGSFYWVETGEALQQTTFETVAVQGAWVYLPATRDAC